MPSILTILLWIGAVVGGLIILYLAFMTIGTIVTLALGNKPEGVEITIDAPASCRVGEDFNLVVGIGDTLGRARRLRSVDIDDSYLKGLVVARVEPPPVDPRGKPTLGTHVYPLDRTIPANGTETVRFTIHAAREGDFAGDVTIYVDSNTFRYERRAVRTVVRS